MCFQSPHPPLVPQEASSRFREARGSPTRTVHPPTRLFSAMNVKPPSSSVPQSVVRLLIIENDEILGTCLLEHFRSAHYTASAVGDADTALRSLSQPPEYDIALLDVQLPGTSGFDLLDRAQQLPIDTSFFILSARASLEDRLRGFDLGAADYLKKPFDLEELEARVESVLRSRLAPASNRSHVYTHDDLTIDFASHECFRDGQQIFLSALEFQILECLVENRGRVLSREELRSVIWQNENAVSLRTIDWHVAKIRDKIEPDPQKPAFLRVVCGKGYEFVR